MKDTQMTDNDPRCGAVDEGLVAHLDHRDGAGRHPIPRLPHRGADRPRQLRADDLADDARRSAERQQGDLLDAALMAAVDHGPQAPSIAIARMATTCGVGLNNAMASAVNVLGDVHGGAGEQAVELYQAIAARVEAGRDGGGRSTIRARRVFRRPRQVRARLRTPVPSDRSARRGACSSWSTRRPGTGS